jgi:peptidyl-prolyl cis-trans isomerase SurA
MGPSQATDSKSFPIGARRGSFAASTIRCGASVLSARLPSVLSSVLSIGAFIVLATALPLLARPARAAETLVEGIAAQVGNDIVLVSEVMEIARPVEERMREAGAPESEVQKVRRDALDRLIEGKLLTSVVERLELGAEREEIDSAVAAIAEDNGLTTEELYKSIQSHGLSVDEYRKKIQGEIERSKVVNAMVRSRVEVTQDELQALYDERFSKQPTGGEEVYLRHIVVRNSGGAAASSAEACTRIATARTEVESGIDFQEVARRTTEMNPEREGDLGWIHDSELASWMDSAIEGLSPGQMTPPIEMPFGCNLLELVDRRPFKAVTFEEAQPQLRNLLFQQKTEAEYVKWIDVLRKQTHIERKGSFGG